MVSAAIAALVDGAALVGNPAALHTSGRRARSLLEDAREQLAEAVGAHPSEVVFTSGGSEADTIAVHAGLRRCADARVLVGATEHPAVASAVGRWPGVERLGCDRDGVAVLAEDEGSPVALVSLMAVNNETGTIQPLEDAVGWAHGRGAWFHTDAVQALGHVPVDFAACGADMMSLSAHKVGGPVGIGALLVRRDVTVPSWGLGGAQERDMRSGTQMTMLAASFAAAASQASRGLQRESDRLRLLRDGLVARIRSTITGSHVNGGDLVSPAIVNVTFDQTRADDVLLLLDEAGFDCSTGSACRAGVHQPSEVLLAMGCTLEQAASSVRFSFGPSTTADEIDRLAAVLPDVVSRARTAWAVGEQR